MIYVTFPTPTPRPYFLHVLPPTPCTPPSDKERRKPSNHFMMALSTPISPPLPPPPPPPPLLLRLQPLEPQPRPHSHPFSPRSHSPLPPSSPLSPHQPSTAAVTTTTTTKAPTNIHVQHRRISPSISLSNPGTLLTLAALARDKTANALASLSEPSLRPFSRSSSLYHSALASPPVSATLPPRNTFGLRSADRQTVEKEAFPKDNKSGSLSSASSASSATWSASRLEAVLQPALLRTDPPSQAYLNTTTDNPLPIVFVPPSPGNPGDMHQSSSRLLRMTEDDRPFTRVSEAEEAEGEGEEE